MIFINHCSNAKQAQDYFTKHLAVGDYFSKDTAELKGIWHGRGAEMLGLSGEVRKEDFFALCQNVNPQTGEQLTVRTKEARRILTDFTFDAPKAVSLAYELGGDERVLDVFRDSVRETMAQIEDAVQTRIRKRGSDTNRTTGNLVWAEHIHRTTRPVEGLSDPLIHCHATVANATFDSVENRWKAVQLGDIVRDKGFYQAAFHARLASKLKELGYGIKKDGKSFTLAGTDRSTIEKFSRRTALIDAAAERLGIDDAKAKGELGRKTREKKSKTPQSMAELRKEWDSRLTAEERLAIHTGGSGWELGDQPITPEQAKDYALEHSFQNSSAVSDKRLQQEALTYAVGSVRPEDVADIAQNPEAIAVPHNGQLMVTTKTVLRDEVAMLQFAKDGQRKFRPFANESDIPADAFAGLTEEQRKAALHVLTSRDQISGVVGKAGVGKSFMMRTTIEALQNASGLKVFVFAPSSQASRGVLKKEGFKNAETLEMLLRNEKLQEQAKGQVLWVDEAGLISSRDMRRLMEVAGKNNNRVILSGDYTQLPSVEAGDAFRLLEKEGGVRLAKLTQIRRQSDPEYRKAVEAIAQGSGKAAQKGFDKLDAMGCVIEATGVERHSLLVADYLKARDDGRSALIVIPTHAEAERLTAELRGVLKQRGALGTEHEFITRKSTNFSEAQKGDSRNYEPGMIVEFSDAIAGKRQRVDGKRVSVGGFAKGEAAVVSSVEEGRVKLLRRDGTEAFLPEDDRDRFQVYRTRTTSIAKGDRIRITKNAEAKVDGQAKGVRINNGDLFTVEGFDKSGNIRLENGKLLAKSFAHMQLGYCDTAYSSQGKTTDRVFISVGSESLSAINQQGWYVAASRGKEEAKIYVASKEEVRDAIARTGERLSAVELTHTRLRDTWRRRFQQTFERNRVARFLKQRADAIALAWRERGREGASYA